MKIFNVHLKAEYSAQYVYRNRKLAEKLVNILGDAFTIEETEIDLYKSILESDLYPYHVRYNKLFNEFKVFLDVGCLLYKGFRDKVRYSTTCYLYLLAKNEEDAIEKAKPLIRDYLNTHDVDDPEFYELD